MFTHFPCKNKGSIAKKPEINLNCYDGFTALICYGGKDLGPLRMAQVMRRKMRSVQLGFSFPW
jgi:hypothetical protein